MKCPECTKRFDDYSEHREAARVQNHLLEKHGIRKTIAEILGPREAGQHAKKASESEAK